MKKYLVLAFIVFLPLNVWARHRIVLVGIDGLGGSTISVDNAPNIYKLMAEGSYTLKMKNVEGGLSSPNWVAILGKPSIFSLFRKERPHLDVKAIYNWRSFKDIIGGEDIKMDWSISGNSAFRSARKSLKFTDFLLTYFVDVDNAGRSNSWGGEKYLEAVGEVDGRIGGLIRRLKKNKNYKDTFFVVVSGHAGGGVKVQKVPFIIKGPRIKKNFNMGEGYTISDISPTIADLFGLTKPKSWVGKSFSDKIQFE